MSTLIYRRAADGGPLPLDEPPGPATILIVDDSPFEHQVIARLLEGVQGLRVVFADGGAAGLEAVGREAPDVILTDLMMPDMDGLELVQRVRERHPAIPLILMTAYGSEEAAVRALRAGAANYIPKKDLTAELANMVRQVLSLTAVDRRRRELLRCLRSWDATFELGNDPDLIVSLMQLIQEELDGLGIFDRTARIRVGVALQEALTNALYHGNLEVDSELRQDDERRFFALAEARRAVEPYMSRRLTVRIHLDRVAATFVIVDEGPGFDISRIDRPIDAEDLTRVGGRGLLLIRTFMDEVVFNGTGNQITMVKRLAGCGCP